MSRLSDSLPNFPDLPSDPESVSRRAEVRAKRDAENAEHERRMAAQQRASRWAEAKGSLPARHVAELARGLEWPEKAAPKAMAVRQRIVERGCACLLGPSGTGKTQMATEAARAFVESGGGGVAFFGLFLLLQTIKASAYDDHEKSPLDRFVRVGLLIIDEIHEQRMSNDDALWFTTLFNARYEAMRPIILIGNTNPQEMPKIVGPSVWSRMEETGVIVVCDWPSFRRRG